jgi:hypothetical protein
MLRIPLPFDDTALLLIPRWSELGIPLQVTVLALVGLLPILLVLWLYRYELYLVRRSAARFLLSLRLLVLLLLWFVVGLQPIVARYSTEELPGRVMVAVDRSHSMDVTDPQRTVVEKLRLARALKVKLAAGQPSAEQIDGWIKHYEVKGDATEPAWVGAEEAINDPERRRTLERERHAAHDELCARVDKLTRGDITRTLLAADGGGFLQTIGRKHQVELIGFHQEAWDVKPDKADDLFRTPDAPAPAAAGEAKKLASEPHPGASFTDLRLPLLRALERSGPDRGRVLGVVLMTDGQHNWGPSPVPKAIELGDRKVPILPVALGARQAPPDVAIVEVKAPANVFKGVDANIETRVKVSGLPAQEVIVDLLQGGKVVEPEHTRTIQHDGADRIYPVRFQVRMDQVGTQTLEIKARPANRDVREVNLANNEASTVIRVARDKARVLLVDGEARWEYHYLANALRRDRSMEPDSVVFVQPRIGKVSEPELEKIGNPRLTLPPAPAPPADGAARGMPEQPDPLAKYDCIILGDVSPEQLRQTDRQRLEKYVAERGGTLVVLAGKRFMPLGFQDATGEDDLLMKMLPVQQARAVSPAGGFPVTLTHEGGLTTYLQMEPEPEKSAARWAELPRHFWGVVGRTKPGAVSLAYLADEPGQPPANDAKSKDAAENTQALIARQNYGFGRVLFVGLDSTWRWRFKVGDTYHHRFWGQVARWAASDKLLPAGNRHVRYGSRQPVYRQGREVEVVARLAEDLPPPAPGFLAGARIHRRTADGKEEAVALVPLAHGDAQPRVLEGQVRDLPPGQYRVELEIPSLSDKLKAPPEPEDETEDKQRRDTFTVLPPDGGEMVDLATNWTLLQDLAARTKGEVVPPEDIGRLTDRLVSQVVTRELREDEKLWQDAPLVWATLGLVLLLLTGEWVGRKLSGLP